MYGNKRWTLEQLKEAIKTSISIRECISKLGLVEAGGNYQTIKKYVEAYNLDTSHWLGQGYLKGKRHNYNSQPIEELMIQHGQRKHARVIKKYLIDNNILSYECSCCGISDWLNKSLTLEIDHINGIPTDHRLENLRLLCPNCHSQTPTFRKGGLKNKKPKRVCVDCGGSLAKAPSSAVQRCKKCHLQRLKDGKCLVRNQRENKANKLLDAMTDKELIKKVLKLGYSAFGREIGLSKTTVRNYCFKRNLTSTINDLKKKK